MSKTIFRKSLCVLIVSVAFIFFFAIDTKAYSEIEQNVDSLPSNLSEDVRQDLSYIGADSTDINDLSKIDFSLVLNLIFSKIEQSSYTPLSCCAVVIAMLLLCALLCGYNSTLSLNTLKDVMSIVSTLSITVTLINPVVSLINRCVATITDASNFMLIYIPIMLSILAFSGHAVSSSLYYSMMVFACQTVSQLSTKLITPLLSLYLSFCVSASITDKVDLTGLCNLFSKVIKWMISFIMTLFSALLAIRSMITTAYDSVTARAVRFTMSSFIPVVGAALSESYKTIQGSVNLLRTGAGVFVIIAVFVVFLPSIAECLVWLLSINVCKSVAQIIGVKSPVVLLTNISSTISVIFAIIVCIMAIFIICTALLISIGGNTSG